MAASVAQLREALGERFPGAQPLVYGTAAAVGTGIGVLDGLLPNRGLPRGRLTVWRPGGGATAVLRAANRSVLESGERAAWIDAAGTLSGEHWTGSLLVRPGRPEHGFACAEEVLRSGGFALVVLSGGGPGFGSVAARLSRAVREGGGAFVAISEHAALAHLRVASQLVSGETAWRSGAFGEPVEVESVLVRVDASALGWSGRTTFRLPVLGRGPRLAPDPLLVDRRGVPHRSGRWSGPRAAQVRRAASTASPERVEPPPRTQPLVTNRSCTG